MKTYQIASQNRQNTFTGKVIFALLIAVGTTSLLVSGPVETTSGQGNQDELEYGVIYSCPQMNNYEFKVISCDAKNWCQVFVANQYSPGGGNITGQGKSTVLSMMKKGECSVKGRAPAGNEKTGQTEVKNEDTQVETVGRVEATSTSACPNDPTLSSKPKASDSMELKSKRAILARFQQAVDKGEKVGVGIVFDSFQIGPPRTNIRGVNYYEDAPVGAKIYPVKSKFTLCSLFSTEITKDVTDGRYECFKDNFGEWACGTATGYRIIKTTYEKIKK